MGFTPPPCSNSHGKSSHFFNFRFSLFTPLLVLFLLIMGNSPAWAGWRFQGQNGTDENWGRGDNMTQVGSSDIWYYKISNLNNDIQFKINNGNWDGEKQKYWSANHDDQNRGNVQLEDAKDGDSEGKNRFKYSRNTNFGKDVARDLYIFVKGDANNPSTNDRVWAIAVTPGSGAISKAYSLRGDLWLDADGGWASKNNQRNPVFVNMTNDVAAQLSYLIPIPSGSNAMKSRFTLISAESPTNENKLETSTSTSSLGDGNYSPDSNNGGKYRLTIPANGGSYPTVKRIVLDYYASGKLRARLEDYIVKRDGWHLYIDDKYMGAMSNSGSFTVEGLASGTHTMYIANYSHNSINSSAYDPYSDNGGKIHAQQWFGGLFIDMNPAHSNVTFEDKKAYYNSSDSYFGPQTYPIADTKNARGKFKINKKSNVEFTFDGGVITINAVDHAETFIDEVYVYGAGGTNWVTGWSKPVEDYKMTISDGVASKTFYNVKGDGLNFKVWNKTTSSDIDWSAYDSSKSENVSCSNCSANNICFNLGSNIYDVTVYTDGSKVWVKAKQHITPSNNWRVTGTFNGWSQNNEQMSNDATNGCKTVTISNISKAYDKNGHGWIKFKLFEGTEWKNSITADNSTVIGMDGTVIGTVADDNEKDDGRIIVQVDETSDITFSYYQYAGGVNIVTVKRTTATPAVPDYQPWSGDSYKDWYLTGDFTKPGVFDDWEQNPSGYKFTTNGDNYQTVSITLDPNDASIFYNHDGHKLTRFEIIRQGTWNDPRINKPHFDASTSNCELKTDWKDAGSNRMSLELTAKSVIKFDIWRWGTTPSSADRKVTITITPVPQVTVTFMANGETFATQVFDKGGKATIPVGAPIRDGYTFNGWDWDFNNTVNENRTIDAVWAYKSIESVSLNKSALTFFENSAPQTLTASYLPADVIGVTYNWSVAPAGVVNVDNNGVVSVVNPGTATITCTATDQEGRSRFATCAVTVHEGEGCVMEEQAIFSHTILGNSIMGGSASNTLPEQESLNAGMEPTCRKIKMYYGNLTSEFTADDNGIVKAKSGLSDNSDVWYEIKGGTNSDAIDGNFYYLKNVKTGGYITRGEGQFGTNVDWYFYTTITSPTNEKTNLYQFIYTKKDGQENQKRICSVWEYSGMASNKTYGLHRRNQDWADNYKDHCPNPMIVFGRGENQGNSTLNVNFIVIEANASNPDYLSTPIVYNTRSYYRFAQNAAVSMTLDKKLRADDKIVVYCYNPSNAARNGGLYINKEKVADISIPANSENIFEYVTVDANAGKNTIEVRSDDNHFCVASVEVLRSLPVAAQDPMLTWSAPANYYTRLAAGPFTFEASSAKSSGPITYIISDENVATVDADGTVTPKTNGTTIITATIEQYLCFGESSIQYNVVVEPTLQEAIDATPVGGTLTLTHDYSENAVINKAITLDANGHTIGDLTVEFEGDLTLSSKLTVRDFTICAKAGNTSIPAASGQVRNASELKVNGNAYFLYTVDPSGQIHYGWYDFTVPFPINIVSGIKGIQGGVLKEDFRNGVDYAVMEYFGDKQAQGQYPYKKFSGVMQPKKLYTITLSDYNTLRMQKTADGALVAGDEVTLNEYAGDDINKNWNGVGNGTLHHADAGISGDYIQVYQSGNRTFLTVDKNDYSLVVGSAFMVQETGTMILNQANGNKPLLAPSRYESAPATAIQIASEGKPFSDQLFITASETGGQAYTPGVDVAKAGELGSASVPQIWTNAYNSSLCVHEAQLINGKALYKLSIYAPVAGTYTLTSKNIPADYSLYLTQNGMIVSELSDTHTLDLSKGITTEYGLLLTEIYNSPTGIENTQTDKIQTTKIIRNGVLYILHNGKVYNAQGAMVK